jgi:hypothetical protein
MKIFRGRAGSFWMRWHRALPDIFGTRQSATTMSMPHHVPTVKMIHAPEQLLPQIFTTVMANDQHHGNRQHERTYYDRHQGFAHRPLLPACGCRSQCHCRCWPPLLSHCRRTCSNVCLRRFKRPRWRSGCYTSVTRIGFTQAESERRVVMKTAIRRQLPSFSEAG